MVPNVEVDCLSMKAGIFSEEIMDKFCMPICMKIQMPGTYTKANGLDDAFVPKHYECIAQLWQAKIVNGVVVSNSASEVQEIVYLSCLAKFDSIMIVVYMSFAFED